MNQHSYPEKNGHTAPEPANPPHPPQQEGAHSPTLSEELDELQSPVPADRLEPGPSTESGHVPFFAGETVFAPHAGEERPFVEFNQVSIAFGQQHVLDEVSFHVGRGQTLCILGRSGVGKSVSLRILLGFLKADSGSVRVDGEEITTMDERGLQKVRKRVTMVFQNGALFDSLTVGENIAFPLREKAGWPKTRFRSSLTACLSWWKPASSSTCFLPASPLGKGAALPSPGRWPRSRRRSSMTSPRRWSIQSWPTSSAILFSGSRCNWG